jgi:hypothetical protein
MSHIHHLSRRRAMLAGASTIAALAIVATAAEAKSIAPIAETGSPTAPVLRQPDDAELLALAERFDPLWRAWVDQMAADHLERYELELAVEQATGIKLAAVGNDWNRETQPYWRARKKALDAIPRDPREKENDREFGALRDALNEIGADILAINAETREGIGLQARAMLVASFENIEPSFEWDGEAPDEWMRCLLRSLCAYCGIAFPVYRSFTELLIEREG